MSSKRMPQGMCRIILSAKADFADITLYKILDAALVHGLSLCLPFKQIYLWFIFFVIIAQRFQQMLGQNGKAVSFSFTGYHFYLESFGVNIAEFDVAQFIHPHAGTIKQRNHHKVFGIGNYRKKFLDLFLAKNLWQF